MDSSSAQADLVVTGARVFTGGDADPVAGVVAVRGDRIIAVGDAAVEDLTGPGTEIVEAPGGLVVPGFQDAHVHAPFAGHNLLRLWLNDDKGREAYLAHIKRYADEHPEQEWIVGGGWAME